MTLSRIGAVFEKLVATMWRIAPRRRRQGRCASSRRAHSTYRREPSRCAGPLCAATIARRIFLSGLRSLRLAREFSETNPGESKASLSEVRRGIELADRLSFSQSATGQIALLFHGM